MEIRGFEKFSLVDYDGYIACTVFTEACNFKCPFCHNSSLVYGDKNLAIISEEEIFEYLEKRKSLIDAVCITGGEPTLQSDLIEFIYKIKSKGFLVKLDTNGTNSFILKNLLEKNLIDYVAMDIKNSEKNYAKTAGIANCKIDEIKKSIDLLKQSKIKYEFRTTLIYEFHETEDIIELSKWLADSQKFVFQHFKDNDGCKERGLNEVSKEKALEYADIMRTTVNNVIIRGY